MFFEDYLPLFEVLCAYVYSSLKQSSKKDTFFRVEIDGLPLIGLPIWMLPRNARLSVYSVQFGHRKTMDTAPLQFVVCH